MKLTTPEISWHGKKPVLSVDFCKTGSTLKFATAGADNDVKLWTVSSDTKGSQKVEFLANLSRHIKAVNVVRFSPNEELLASGGDDCCVILWKLSVNQEQSIQALKDSDDDIDNRESWTASKVLRGHIEDVYDIAWSPDGSQLISGSVDNSAIIWDVMKGAKLVILKDHKHYIQGVCWDPLGQYVVTNSTDRSCRLYSTQTHRCCYNINKLSSSSNIKIPEGGELKQLKMFHDESVLSFFRRPSFTPDGSLLIVPAGRIDMSNQVLNTTYVFTRGSPNKPVLYLPSPKKPTVAVRCCPVLFELRKKDKDCDKENNQDNLPLFQLPYRMVFAVASLNAVFLYDTQQKLPFGYISNIHYSGITDVTWSSNGSTLVVCSSDGYCSLINFDDGEIGSPYKMTVKEVLDARFINNQPANSTPNMETPDNSGKAAKRVVLTPIQKMEVDETPSTPNNEPGTKKRDTPSIQKFAVPVSQLQQNSTPSKPTNKVTPRRVQLLTSQPKVDNSIKTIPQTGTNHTNAVLNKISQLTTSSTSQSLPNQAKGALVEGQLDQSKARRVELISHSGTDQTLPNNDRQTNSMDFQPGGQTAKLIQRRVELLTQPMPGQVASSQAEMLSQPDTQTTQIENTSNPKSRRVQLVSQPMTSRQPPNWSGTIQSVKSKPAQSKVKQDGGDVKPRRVQLMSQPVTSSQPPNGSGACQSVECKATQSKQEHNGNDVKPRRVQLISQPLVNQSAPNYSPKAQPVVLKSETQQNVSNLKPNSMEDKPSPTVNQVISQNPQAQTKTGLLQAQPYQPLTEGTLTQNVNNEKSKRGELISQSIVSQTTESPDVDQSVSISKPRRVALVTLPMAGQETSAGSQSTSRVELPPQLNRGQETTGDSQVTDTKASEAKAKSSLNQKVCIPKRVEAGTEPRERQATSYAAATMDKEAHSGDSSTKARRVELISEELVNKVSNAGSYSQPKEQSTLIKKVSDQNPRREEPLSQSQLQPSCISAPQIHQNKDVESQINPDAKLDSKDGSHRARNPIPLEPVVIVLE